MKASGNLVEDKSIGELQKMVHNVNLPMGVRNAAAKRFKVLRRQTKRENGFKQELRNSGREEEAGA